MNKARQNAKASMTRHSKVHFQSTFLNKEQHISEFQPPLWHTTPENDYPFEAKRTCTYVLASSDH